MSIEFLGGTFGIEMTCDNCDTRKSYEDTYEAKADGWVTRKPDGEWKNFCSNECWLEWRRLHQFTERDEHGKC